MKSITSILLMLTATLHAGDVNRASSWNPLQRGTRSTPPQAQAAQPQAEPQAATAALLCTVETDRPVLPAGKVERSIVKVTLDADRPAVSTERPPVNLAIVLDRSNSMNGPKWDTAKMTAINAMKRLGPKDRFSLVMFANESMVVIPATPASAKLAANGAKIRGIPTRSGSCMFGGISMAAAELRKGMDGNYVHRMVLISDGIANEGPNSAVEMGRLGTALRKEGISVSTIGIGDDYHEDLMIHLSERSDGNTYFADALEQMPAIFDAELGDVLSVIAKRVNLEIEFKPGVRPIRLIGREGRVSPNRVEVFMNQIYQGKDKYVLIEVEVAPGEAGTRRDMLTARAVYLAPPNPGITTVETPVFGCLFSESTDEVQSSYNARVVSDYAFNKLAVTQSQAVQLWDEGKQQEAIQLLNDNAALANGWGVQNNDPQLQQEAQRLNLETQYVADQGLSKKQRKDWVSRSGQVRYQQTYQNPPVQSIQQLEQQGYYYKEETPPQEQQKPNAQPKSWSSLKVRK